MQATKVCIYCSSEFVEKYAYRESKFCSRRCYLKDRWVNRRLDPQYVRAKRRAYQRRWIERLKLEHPERIRAYRAKAHAKRRVSPAHVRDKERMREQAWRFRMWEQKHMNPLFFDDLKDCGLSMIGKHELENPSYKIVMHGRIKIEKEKYE